MGFVPQGQQQLQMWQMNQMQGPPGPPMIIREPPNLNVLPVLRHGEEAARICDMALDIRGPNDSNLKTIIRSDANAQMAFHIHQALGLALDYYKSRSTSPWRREQQPPPRSNQAGLMPNPFQPVPPPRAADYSKDNVDSGWDPDYAENSSNGSGYNGNKRSPMGLSAADQKRFRKY